MYAQKVGRAQEDCGIRSITAIVIVQATEMQPLTQTIITLMLRKTLCSIRDNIRYGDNRVENDRELYKILDKVTLEDFKDKTVEAQYGSLQAQLVTEQMPESSLELSGTAEEGVFQVRIAKADAIALDENLADVFLKEHDDLAQTKVELSYEPQGVVAGVVKGEEDLLAEINRMIAEVTEQKLYVQWLDAATLQAVKLEADSID